MPQKIAAITDEEASQMARPEVMLFRVHGMDCAEEAATLRRELAPLVDEEGVTFDFLNGRMAVQRARTNASSEEILKAVARTGMRADFLDEQTAAKGERRSAATFGDIIPSVGSGVFLLVGFITHVLAAKGIAGALGYEGMGHSQGVPLLAKIFYLLAVFAGGWKVFPKAWAAARSRRPNMNLLMTIAVIGAVGIGEWLEAATVSFLFAVSLALESWSVGRAKRAVSALMRLSPASARVIQPEGGSTEIPVEEVSIGSRFQVKPGERIPLDGIVVSGASEVNQAPVTGESMPVTVVPGQTVYAGTICEDGVLEIECTKRSSDTTLAHIIRMVGEAHLRRAPSERWVERFAGVYTPAVLGVALLTFLIPSIVLGGDWREWLYRSLVFLVIGCPCALVISTPVSIVAALARAARNGVLVKSGLHMELPARIRAIALDKTGTLTEGRPSVLRVVPLSGHSEADLLQRVASLEALSDHPLARAVVAYAAEQGISAQPVEAFKEIKGKGLTGRLNGSSYWVGSHRYLEEMGQETAEIHRQLEEIAREGRTVVVVGNERHVCGFLALADTVRPSASAALQNVRRLGVEHVVMLTGDNRETAEAIAREVGIDEIRAELLPADKVAAIDELVERYGQVAMIGDGINDAPAMARATIGLAMGAAGSDAAIEAADVAFMSDDLSKLPWLIEHSKRTVGVIRQNVIFALAVKAVFVVLTLLGYGSLWMAIAADMGASLLVTFNALRLLGESPTNLPRAVR